MNIETSEPREWESFEEQPQGRSKTSHRMLYDAEVEIIRQQIGDLEDIRFRLGLSARKMAQLLLVDPSAWTRWTKKITPPPPHVFRALQWYLTLQEKNPGFTPQIFLASQWHSRKKQDEMQDGELREQVKWLNEKVMELETQKKETPPHSRKYFLSNIVPLIGALLLGFLWGRL